MKQILPILTFQLLVLLTPAFHSYAQVPSAREVLQEMTAAAASVKNIRYKLQSRHMNAGQNDSVFSASSIVWAVRVPSDTIYGAHFHVKQTSDNGQADFYYDGQKGIDVYHTHKIAGNAKRITVMEPFRMSNGYNAVQTLMTAVFGYSQELLSPSVPSHWVKHIDSMVVNDESENWLISWTEEVPADDFRAYYRVYVNKQNHLLHRIHRKAVWQSVPMTTDAVITDIRINHSSDLDSVRLTETYPDYRITHVNRKNYGTASPAGNQNDTSSLLMTKAKTYAYTSLEGKPVSFKPQKGKVLLLDFWETWCGYCFLAMPKIKHLYEQYNSKGLEVIGIVTENKEQVRKIVAAQNFPYPTVFGDETIKRDFKLVDRPRYILIDEEGTVIGDTSGNLEQISEMIKKLLH